MTFFLEKKIWLSWQNREKIWSAKISIFEKMLRNPKKNCRKISSFHMLAIYPKRNPKNLKIQILPKLLNETDVFLRGWKFSTFHIHHLNPRRNQHQNFSRIFFQKPKIFNRKNHKFENSTKIKIQKNSNFFRVGK